MATVEVTHTMETLEKDSKYPIESQNSDDNGVAEDGPLGDTPMEFIERKDLRQGLHQRHIQMIALAGTIGTGLFLGSGRALAAGGPAGIVIGYALTGIIVSGVVISIAELSTLVPLSGAIVRHAEYFVDPALSFALGYNAVYNYLITVAAEIVAAAVLMQFWITMNSAIWITVFGVFLFASNLFLVRIYGELEFVFATLKIMLIVGLTIMTIVLTAGGGPTHQVIGFRYWHNPGPFVQYLGFGGSLGQFMGFWTVFSNAVYAYSGIETISIAAAETKQARRNIPMAAKRIFWRVLLFYVVSVFMVTLLVPSNDPELLKSTGTAAQSPFVIAATRAGVHTVPSIINFVVLTSAWSAGNSALLFGSRFLYGLAREGHAPRVLKRTSPWGVPYVAVLTVGIWVALGYMSVSSGASVVFTWLQDLISSAALVGWICICLVYLRFYYGLKKQGISRDELPWKGPFQPYLAWMSISSLVILLLTGGYTTFINGMWKTETFIAAYLDIAIILALYFGYKVWIRVTTGEWTGVVGLADMPVGKFVEIAKAEVLEPPPPKTGLRKLNFLWE